jgi:hypothetical protein
VRSQLIALPLLLLALVAALVAAPVGAYYSPPPAGNYPTLPGGENQKPRSITITRATAVHGVVTLRVSIRGFKTYPALFGKRPNKPDGGHWHVFVDGKPNKMSANVTIGKTLKLRPGSHRIFVELANNDHSSLQPRVLSTPVTVRVR